MKSQHFYQTTLNNTVPLHFLSSNDSDPGREILTSYETHSLNAQQFKGELGEIALINTAEGLLNKIYIGLGLKQDEGLAIAYAVNRLPSGSYAPQQPLTPAAMASWALAQYKFDRYKNYTAVPRILAVSPNDLPVVLAETDAIFLVRDLINTPTNDMGPAEMADVLSAMAQTHGAEFKEWIGDALLSDNFPAIHAVGRASALSPRLLSLTYGDKTHPKITLIGKGVCFDSGGLDLKSSSNMRLMKKDMGGAAQVIGLAHLLMTRQVPIRLQVLIPAVENAVGSNAYRPGDILTMRNGLTVEIDNTDAEGRLVVADALVKACEDTPDLLIDFTTLTGAARVAVGTEISALFTNSDELAAQLATSAATTKDPIWRMPLFNDYASMLDSSVADLCNSASSSYAGAITAALFLQRFITPNTPWVHFDLMAWNVKSKPGKPEGGEAMGLRAVADYLIRTYGSQA
jgi:leucyl aminopeptidase